MLWNFIIDNDLIIYGTLIGIACHIGLTYLSFNQTYVDASVQTEAWEDYSPGPSQVLADNLSPVLTDNLTSLDPLTRISPISETIASTTVNTVTTILPIPPVNIEVIPNPDIAVGIINNSYLYADRAEQIADMLGLAFT
jgi:hypothetical protein